MSELTKILELINSGQLITTGGFIVFVIWLYLRTIKERDGVIDELSITRQKYEDLLIKHADDLKHSLEDYNQTMKVLDTAIEYYKLGVINHDNT